MSDLTPADGQRGRAFEKFRDDPDANQRLTAEVARLQAEINRLTAWTTDDAEAWQRPMSYTAARAENRRLQAELAALDPDWRTQIAREVTTLRQELAAAREAFDEIARTDWAVWTAAEALTDVQAIAEKLLARLDHAQAAEHPEGCQCQACRDRDLDKGLRIISPEIFEDVQAAEKEHHPVDCPGGCRGTDFVDRGLHKHSDNDPTDEQAGLLHEICLCRGVRVAEKEPEK